MDQDVSQVITMPIVQFGFAGFCMLLCGFIFWLAKNLFPLFQEVLQVIERNTEAIARQGETNTTLVSKMEALERAVTACTARNRD